MTASVLDRITLAYRPLWGVRRTLCGVALFVRPLPLATGSVEAPVRAAQLLDALQDVLPHDVPPIFLVVQSPALLLDLLQTLQPPPAAGQAGGPVFHTHGFFAPTLVVPAETLGSRPVVEAVQRAHQRGLPLVWQGDASLPPDPSVAGQFGRRFLSLPPAWAAAALRDALRPVEPGTPLPPGRLPGGHLFEGIESRTLMEYCLDRCKAFAIAGWPAEDVVYSMRHMPMQPDHAIVLATLKAIEADRSAEIVERTLGEDPVLVHRFLVYANSPGLGLRSGVESVRHGLMMLGTDTLRSWLVEQLPHASREPALRPIKAAMVMRSRLMDHLLDAGIEEALRREVTICGLFSGLDLLFNEHLSAILGRLPLSQRIYDAMVLHSGPYSASLEMTLALEAGDTDAVRKLAVRHELEPGEVNLALLEMLAALPQLESVGT